MEKFAQRGYVVRETGPVYFTRDMARTIRWFSDVLGWYGEIDEQDADGNAVYGSVFDTPPEYVMLHVAPFTGIHLFPGDPKTELVAFMQVTGIDRLHQLVCENGWEGITPVKEQAWGAKICTVTTIDGYQLRFFESV